MARTLKIASKYEELDAPNAVEESFNVSEFQSLTDKSECKTSEEQLEALKA